MCMRVCIAKRQGTDTLRGSERLFVLDRWGNRQKKRAKARERKRDGENKRED